MDRLLQVIVTGRTGTGGHFLHFIKREFEQFQCFRQGQIRENQPKVNNFCYRWHGDAAILDFGTNKMEIFDLRVVSQLSTNFREMKKKKIDEHVKKIFKYAFGETLFSFVFCINRWLKRIKIIENSSFFFFIFQSFFLENKTRYWIKHAWSFRYWRKEQYIRSANVGGLSTLYINYVILRTSPLKISGFKKLN